jgi:hypothetical protein
MTPQTHVLIDAAAGFVAEETFSGRTAAATWNVRQRTCRGGRSEGVQVVELDNGAMCVDVLPTRGMGIWRARRGDRALGWNAPAREPVHPSFVPLMEPAGLGWLDGFNELLCRCGLESNGPPEFDDAGRLLRPLHGRIANTPAHRVEMSVDESAGTLSLRGVVEEKRFHFQSLRLTTTISTKIGSNEFSWTDEVENIGGRDASMQMLYHFNVGQPLLQPGAKLVAPLVAVAPLTDIAAKEGPENWNVIPPPRQNSAEQVYIADLAADDAGNTRLLFTGLSGNEAVGLAFSKRALPCYTLWRNPPTDADGYVVGLEPGTNYPNPRTFENTQGRVKTLQPGEKWRGDASVTWYAAGDSIGEATSAINAIQKSVTPKIYADPRRTWS